MDQDLVAVDLHGGVDVDVGDADLDVALQAKTMAAMAGDVERDLELLFVGADARTESERKVDTDRLSGRRLERLDLRLIPQSFDRHADRPRDPFREGVVEQDGQVLLLSDHARDQLGAQSRLHLPVDEGGFESRNELRLAADP